MQARQHSLNGDSLQPQQEAVQNARTIVVRERQAQEVAIAAVNAAWTARIVLAAAAKTKKEALDKEAKEQRDKATKRACDLQEQAQRAVERDVLANAAKRSSTSTSPDGSTAPQTTAAETAETAETAAETAETAAKTAETAAETAETAAETIPSANGGDTVEDSTVPAPIAPGLAAAAAMM